MHGLTESPTAQVNRIICLLHLQADRGIKTIRGQSSKALQHVETKSTLQSSIQAVAVVGIKKNSDQYKWYKHTAALKPQTVVQLLHEKWPFNAQHYRVWRLKSACTFCSTWNISSNFRDKTLQATDCISTYNETHNNHDKIHTKN